MQSSTSPYPRHHMVKWQRHKETSSHIRGPMGQPFPSRCDHKAATDKTLWMGAQWLSGRVLDSRPKGRGFEPHRSHCVVSLSKNINPSLVLVQPRKTRSFITERLLMGRKESNQTKTKDPLRYFIGIYSRPRRVLRAVMFTLPCFMFELSPLNEL